MTKIALRRLAIPAGISSVLFLSAFGHLVIELCSQFLPVLYPIFRSQMGLSFTQVGNIALVATTSTTLAQPLFGYVSDRWGPDRQVAVSLVWIGIFMGLVGFAWSYPSLLFIIAVGTLGSAAFHPPAAIIAAANSGARRGTGISIFSVGGNFGSALSPLWMALALGWFGLRGTATFIPIGIFAGTLAYIWLRQVSKTPSTTPTRAATAADGFLLGLILIVVGMMFRSWFQVALITYLPLWLESNNTPETVAASMLSVLLFSLSIGSFVGGPLGDKIGHIRVVILAIIAMPIAHWFLLNTAGWTLIPFLMASGISMGMTYPSTIVLAIESWPHQVGFATGLLMGIGWWPGGIGAAFTGFIADRYSLATSFEMLLIPPIIALVCMITYSALNQRHNRINQRGQSS